MSNPSEASRKAGKSARDATTLKVFPKPSYKLGRFTKTSNIYAWNLPRFCFFRIIFLGAEYSQTLGVVKPPVATGGPLGTNLPRRCREGRL